MNKHDIPCPYCCYHVSIDPKQFKDGAVVKCNHCKMNIKITPHPNYKLRKKEG